MNTNITGHKFLVFVVTILCMVCAVSRTQADSPTPSYKIVEQWRIPNGGFGKAIVIKANPTEAELRSLGEKLKQDTKNDRNAFIFVYDDAHAARNRLAAFNEQFAKPPHAAAVEVK